MGNYQFGGGRNRDVTSRDGVIGRPEVRPLARDAICQTENAAPTIEVKGVNMSVERTKNSSTALVKYIHKQIIHTTGAAVADDEEGSASGSTERQSSVDGISDDLLLVDLLHDLADKILHKQGLFQKLKRTYGLLERKPGGFDPHQPWHLFQAMVNEGRLSARDVLCLQGLLHKCGSPDLVDLVTKHAEKIEAEHGIRVLHFSVPRVEPVQGQRYVSLHVTGADEDGDAPGFLARLARLLGVGVDLIRVVGAQLTGSVWLTLLLPRACVDGLETALQDPQHALHVQLALLGVDHVSTIQVAPDPTRRDLFEAASRGEKYADEIDATLLDILRNAPEPCTDDLGEAAEVMGAAAGQPRDKERKARSKGSQGSRRGREVAMM